MKAAELVFQVNEVERSSKIRRVLSHAVRACDMLLNMRVTAKQIRYNEENEECSCK